MTGSTKQPTDSLGHTFGHAFEAETGFSDRLLHGEAVALGMVLAARYSARQGLVTLDDAERVTRAVDAGTLPFLLLKSVGEASSCRDLSLDDVAAFLDTQLRVH